MSRSINRRCTSQESHCFPRLPFLKEGHRGSKLDSRDRATNSKNQNWHSFANATLLLPKQGFPFTHAKKVRWCWVNKWHTSPSRLALSWGERRAEDCTWNLRTLHCRGCNRLPCEQRSASSTSSRRWQGLRRKHSWRRPAREQWCQRP